MEKGIYTKSKMDFDLGWAWLDFGLNALNLYNIILNAKPHFTRLSLDFITSSQ